MGEEKCVEGVEKYGPYIHIVKPNSYLRDYSCVRLVLIMNVSKQLLISCCFAVSTESKYAFWSSQTLLFVSGSGQKK